MATSETRYTGLTIGQLASAAGVSVEAVRFYERRGLVDRPERPYAGIRRYPEQAVKRIQFIKHAKSLGFTLQEVHEMLVLRADDPATCGEVQRLAQDKLALLHQKMESLSFMESILRTLLQDCRRHVDTTCVCPILEAVGEGLSHTPVPGSLGG